MIDLHLHTDHSPDGQGSVDQYCEAAIDAGLKVIAFTDHFEFDPGYEKLDVQGLVIEVDKARSVYGNRLKILLGAEVSYRCDQEREITDACRDLPVDFLIGSVHAIDSPEFIITDEWGAKAYFCDKCDPEEAFVPYFEEVLCAVKFGYFDVIGHLDCIKRFGISFMGPIRTGDYYGLLRRILDGIVKRGMALEVNTAGLFHHPQEMYPSTQILELYREIGGSYITLGSDAHKPEDIAQGYDRAIEVIKSTGYSSLTFFESHIPKQVPLV